MTDRAGARLADIPGIASRIRVFLLDGMQAYVLHGLGQTAETEIGLFRDGVYVAAAAGDDSALDRLSLAVRAHENKEARTAVLSAAAELIKQDSLDAVLSSEQAVAVMEALNLADVLRGGSLASKMMPAALELDGKAEAVRLAYQEIIGRALAARDERDAQAVQGRRHGRVSPI